MPRFPSPDDPEHLNPDLKAYVRFFPFFSFLLASVAGTRTVSVKKEFHKYIMISINMPPI